MKEYERDMMLSGHKLLPAPLLPLCEQNKFAAFEKEALPAKKTKKEKTKETAKHSEEVAHILEGYCQGLFELLQIIVAKLDKMTDGLAEILIMDSLNEFDHRIKGRKMSRKT